MVSNSDEDRLFYLLSGSCEVLPSSYIKLRSYLNIHSAKIAVRQNLNVFKNRQTSCPYCYSAWTCDTSSFKLLPSKKSKAKKSGKKINVEPGQNESRNLLVLKCKVCTKKSSFSLVKKQKAQEKVPVEEENAKPVKKKKKKKDRSCGLHGVLVNSEKTVGSSPQLLPLKKKEGLKSAKDDHLKTPSQKKSLKLQTKSPTNLPNPKCKLNSPFQASKKLIVNPHYQARTNKLKQMKKQQKLKKLQRAAKARKNVPKKSLQDFLTLI